MDNNTKPEMIADSTSQQQQQQQPDISPGAYPPPLQTPGPSETRSRSRAGSSTRPDAETQLADPSAVSSSGHHRMPSVNSLPPKEGHFGLVSSSGQLVCEFRGPPAVAGEAPRPPSSNVASEEYTTSASFATYEQKSRAGSIPPQPPQNTITNQQQPGGGNPTASTLELVVDHNSYPEAVDRNSYPEVYIPAGQELGQPPPKPPQRHSPPISRKSLPMDSSNSSSDFYSPSPSSPPPAPAYSTPADYKRIGYTGTLDMSTAVATVTPLHMLGDQSDAVDCPFCLRRVETSVKKKASKKTHMWGAILFVSTFFGVVAPYCCDWYPNVEHYCKNCRRKVAQKKFDSDETEALGTRPEDRQVSYFQEPEKPTKKFFRS